MTEISAKYIIQHAQTELGATKMLLTIDEHGSKITRNIVICRQKS